LLLGIYKAQDRVEATNALCRQKQQHASMSTTHMSRDMLHQ